MRALMVISNNMEDVESLATRALLMRAGVTVELGTFAPSLSVTSAFGLPVQADVSCNQIVIDRYDCLVVPGGGYVAETIDQDPGIATLTKTFVEAEKMVAAICAGPRFLGRAGLLDGRQYTAFPGSEVDMPTGQLRQDLKAVTDGMIITARGAGAVYEFAYQIIKYLMGEKSAQALLESIVF
ncbi:MAG: DJ-1/PfpI family protein [Acholeplasmatales bacterium]|nr:MAG: DJ-1/PfpI family protein [Acholeplasmatales bacterium]